MANLAQWVFEVVGYLTSHLVWRALRGSSVSTDPGLDVVWKVLTTTGSSPENAAITIAYVSAPPQPSFQAIAPTLLWGVLTTLAKRRKKRSLGRITHSLTI